MRTMIFTRGRSPMARSARRHLRDIIKHMTVRRVINILGTVVEMFLRRPHLFSHPFFMRIEISPICNLRCIGCSLGGPSRDGTRRGKPKQMSLDLFERSVRDFLPYLVKVNLYDEGEPLLNKDLPKMIACLSRRKVATCVSSNFSLTLSDDYLRELLSCGLNHLIVGTVPRRRVIPITDGEETCLWLSITWKG